jgi:nitronate monooxygenase
LQNQILPSMTPQEILGTELPIFQAPMAGVQDSALAVAVSNAGGIDQDIIPVWASPAPFSAEAAELLTEFRPVVVSFHFGLPSAELLARVKKCGSKILSTQVGTLALVPQIVQRVRIPVIAAGGIADSKGVSAALTLGAAAVQVGTAYLLCAEATTSAVHRAALKSEAARHTALTNLFTGRPARAIVNRIMRELGPISTATPAFPLAAPAIVPLRARAESQGSGDFSPLWSGQNNSGCKEVSASNLTKELACGL